MFLWVTDFYSLEKIISAFRKIVLLYLKMTGAPNRRVWAEINGGRERETDGNGRWGWGDLCSEKGRGEEGVCTVDL